MILADIIALARAGYTPAQVKELMQLNAEQESAKPEAAPEIPPKEERQPDEQNGGAEEHPNEADNKEATAELQKQLDDLRKNLEKAKNDLAAAQKKNTSQDMTGQKEPDTTLEDIVRSFM